MWWFGTFLLDFYLNCFVFPFCVVVLCGRFHCHITWLRRELLSSFWVSFCVCLHCCLYISSYIFCLRLIFRRSRETLVQYLHICTHTENNVQFIYFTRFPFLSILLSFDFPSYRLLCVCSSFLLLFLHVLNTFFVWGARWIFAGSAFAKNQLSLMEWNAHIHTPVQAHKHRTTTTAATTRMRNVQMNSNKKRFLAKLFWNHVPMKHSVRFR